MASRGQVTELLQEWQGGDRSAFDRLVPLIYDDLKRIATYQLARERRDHTLQPAALANESYLRLLRQGRARWRDRAHLLAVSASVMRRILIDHARRRRAKKRVTITLPQIDWRRAHDEGLDLLALERAIEQLAELSPRQARIVEMRFFGGMTIEEAAAVERVSARTVKTDWRMARAWLVDRFDD